MAEPGKDKKRVIELSACRAAVSRASARRLTRDGAAHAVIALVAADRAIPVDRLLQSERGSAAVAQARQLAMYLVHTLLHRTLTETAVVFQRDRTTVAYACALVEDRRESGDLHFDERVARLEEIIGGLTAEGDTEVNRAAG